MRRLVLIGLAAVAFCVTAYGLTRWRELRVARERHLDEEHAQAQDAQRESAIDDSSPGHAKTDSLPDLDAHGVSGVQELTRLELVKLMSKSRPLSREENANLDRGCPGFTCAYQGLGLKRWPEAARGTLAYLTREDALNRHCPSGQENFVFLKQACWLTGKPPRPVPGTREVSLESVTRAKPGLYTFNYAVYFPSTGTYAWINHREYGFPLNLFKPQRAYLSLFPPPLDDTRPAQIYCSTCR